MNRAKATVFFFVLVAAACKARPETETTTEAPMIAPAAQEAAPAANVNTNVGVNGSAAEVAVPADFEEQAIAGINEANLDAEIENLDRELSQ